MFKKILTISTIVLGVIALGLVYYYFFFSKPKVTLTTVTPPTQNNPFPFGQGGTGVNGQNASSTVSGQDQTPQSGNYLEKLRMISDQPVAGTTFVDTKTGEFIRYIEKATGHIYDVSTNSGTVNEISNTTIPKIYEAFFTEGGQGVIARSIPDDVETIETVYAKVPLPVASSTLSTQIGTSTPAIVPLSFTSLPENIAFLSVSPSGKNIFYIQKSASASTGIISLPNGSSKKQIWNSPIKNVLPQFAGETQVLLATAPNASVASYVYAVNASTASQKNILGNIPDVSILSNQTGTDVVYSTSSNGTELLFHYIIATASTTQLTPATFGEKCVFDVTNKNTLYCAVPTTTLSSNDLDNWYLGLTSYSDDIWKYDLKNGTSQLIEDLQLNAGRSIDAINLHINPAGTLLLFQSKTDGTLWSLNVGQ